MPFDLSSDIGGFYSFFGSDVIYTTTISVDRDSLYVNGITEGTFSSDVFYFISFISRYVTFFPILQRQMEAALNFTLNNFI